MICLQRAECICLMFCSELYLSRWEAANSPVPPYVRNKILRGPQIPSAGFVESQLTATPCVGKLEPCSTIGKYSLCFNRGSLCLSAWRVWDISSLDKVFWIQTKDKYLEGRRQPVSLGISGAFFFHALPGEYWRDGQREAGREDNCAVVLAVVGPPNQHSSLKGYCCA